MCGICGFTGIQNNELLARMSALLSHRGPDQDGAVILEGVSLAHRRLSIIDLSEQGRQPLSNEDGSVWSAVNGEIYNFRKLREGLISGGHRFRGRSDSEVVVHAYEEYGDDFVSRLDGMFAIALWDAHRKRLILARDRIGIKPLYYAEAQGAIVFASEVKSILEHPAVRKELNREGFLQYLAFQCIITDETMFRGIQKLPAGTTLSFENGAVSRRRYWSIDEARRAHASEQEVAAALRNAVASHLESDVPLGVLLSGGLDSGTIVALMRERGVERIETFTVGFERPDDEFAPARLVAQKFKTNHHELLVQPHGLPGLLEKIVWHMDEPLADGGAIATYLALERVKEFVKVVLLGEGGDETLGGYNWYRLSFPPFSLLPQQLRQDLYFYLTTYYRESFSEPRTAFKALFKRERPFLDAMSLFEIKNVLPNGPLMKDDKMTMAHSVEARVPFLDHAFVSTALGLEASRRVSAFSTKIFLRKLMRGVLPEPILKRRKHGFILPVETWLAEDLRDFAYDTLSCSDAWTIQLFPRPRIKQLFQKSRGFAAIEKNSILWKLLIFEVWRKKYLA